MLPKKGQSYHLCMTVSSGHGHLGHIPLFALTFSFFLMFGQVPPARMVFMKPTSECLPCLWSLLVSFMVEQQEYGLYIPLDPFFVVARMVDGQAELVEGEDFDRIQPRLEAELEEREWPE